MLLLLGEGGPFAVVALALGGVGEGPVVGLRIDEARVGDLDEAAVALRREEAIRRAKPSYRRTVPTRQGRCRRSLPGPSSACRAAAARRTSRVSQRENRSEPSLVRWWESKNISSSSAHPRASIRGTPWRAARARSQAADSARPPGGYQERNSGPSGVARKTTRVPPRGGAAPGRPAARRPAWGRRVTGFAAGMILVPGMSQRLPPRLGRPLGPRASPRAAVAGGARGGGARMRRGSGGRRGSGSRAPAGSQRRADPRSARPGPWRRISSASASSS